MSSRRRLSEGLLRLSRTELGEDPFGEEPSTKVAKKRLDALLVDGDPNAAGVIQSAIESFAQELAGVMQQFPKMKAWKAAERLVI